MSTVAKSKLARQHGFSLIEVLVAVLVVALGILAMVAMQVNATKLTKSSEIRAMGAMLASDLADRMRANHEGFVNGAYVLNEQYPADGAVTLPSKTIAEQCNQASTTCTAQQIADADKADWGRSVFRALPNGSAWISGVDAVNNSVDVWLVWSEAKDPFSKDRNGDECPSNLVASPANAQATAVTPRCMYFHINL